jgi:hypothetical protein
LQVSVFFGFFKEDKTIKGKNQKEQKNPTVSIASITVPMDY